MFPASLPFPLPQVHVHDHDEISASDILGTAAVTMQDMIRLGHGPGHEMEFVLKGVTGKQAGKSTITLGFQTSERAKRGMSIEAKQKEEAQQVREEKELDAHPRIRKEHGVYFVGGALVVLGH